MQIENLIRLWSKYAQVMPSIPDTIILLRDFTAWALLVFLVIGGMRQVWVWGWLYKEMRDRLAALEVKFEANQKLLFDAIDKLGEAVKLAQQMQNRHRRED